MEWLLCLVGYLVVTLVCFLFFWALCAGGSWDDEMRLREQRQARRLQQAVDRGEERRTFGES